MPVPAREDNPNRARGSGGKFHKEMEQPGPRPSTRARRCQSPRVRRSLRDGERKAAEYTKMAAVRLPPVRERKRPNGDGFSPRPMIRTRKGGASERGAPGGKPRRGKPQPPASPPRLKKTRGPRVPQGSGPGYNGAPASPAGNMTMCVFATLARSLGAPHSPRSPPTRASGLLFAPASKSPKTARKNGIFSPKMPKTGPKSRF